MAIATTSATFFPHLEHRMRSASSRRVVLTEAASWWPARARKRIPAGATYAVAPQRLIDAGAFLLLECFVASLNV